MGKEELSIVIPCYNEEKNIKLIVERFGKFLKKNVELILVDNGSSDNTQKEIKKYSRKNSSVKLVHIKENIGYGNGIYKGLLSAKGEYLAWTHADLQIDPVTVIQAFDIINKQKTPKKAFIKGGRKGRSFTDKFFEVGMSLFESLILGIYLFDINSQPNLFHKSLLNLTKNPPKDFSFDLYFYYIAKTNGYQIIKFPVAYGKRLFGHSAWNFGISSRVNLTRRTIEFTFKLRKYLKQKQA